MAARLQDPAAISPATGGGGGRAATRAELQVIPSRVEKREHGSGKVFSWMVVWALGYLGLWDWAGARTIATGII